MERGFDSISPASSRYDPSTRVKLKQVDNWDEVFPRVLKYAKSRAWKFGMSGIEVDPFALINEAVARAYGIGTRESFRNWDQEKCPECHDFLIGIIRSITGHEAKHLSKFPIESILEDDGSFRERMLLNKEDETQKTSGAMNPEDELAEEESLRSLMDEMEKISLEDEDLGLVILCIQDGSGKARDIAAETGFDIEKVYQLRRKLRQRLAKFKPEPKK